MEAYGRHATSSKAGKDVDYQLPGISNLKALSAAGSSPDSTVTCSGKSLSLSTIFLFHACLSRNDMSPKEHKGLKNTRTSIWALFDSGNVY